jgi:hypothetical protein
MKYPNDTRVVFLDLDGVMNSNDYYVARGPRTPSNDVDEFYLNMIDPSAVTTLNSLVEQHNFNVVISSTWRDSAIELKVLERSGFTGKILGRTPLYTEMPPMSHIKPKTYVRGHEIQQWINDNIERPHEYSSYIIFDDDSDMLEDQMGNFIQIDFMKGLQLTDIKKAIETLKK